MRWIKQGRIRKRRAYDIGSVRWDFMRDLLNLVI